MNVCLISREFPPFIGGGIGTYTRHLAFALASGGHRPVVLTTADDGRERREERAGVTIVRLPFLAGDDWSRPHPAIATPEVLGAFRAFVPESVFAMQIARALPRLVEEFAIDAVEAPDTGALAWFTLNQRRTGKAWTGAEPPLITTVHSPTAWIASINGGLPLSAKEAALATMERNSALWSDGLTSPSATMARWVEREWQSPGGGSIAVVPNPLGDLEPAARRIADGARSPAALAGPPRVLFVGRLEPRKGVDALLHALALVGPGARTDFVGEDMPDPRTGLEYGASLFRTLPAAVRERIALRGRLDPEAVVSLRAQAQIAVVPSPTDNFPYTCVEAMAAGQVVVAARAGGMAELIRDGTDGLLFTPGDPDDCAASLRRAIGLSPADRASLARSAAARVLEVCGNERIVAARIEQYRCAGEGRRAGAGTSPCDLVCVNGAGAPEALLHQLADAASRPGIDFAHGWTRVAGGPVQAFGTPCADSLSGAGRPLGPLMVRREALDRVRGALDVSEAAESRGTWPHLCVPAVWPLAAALAAAGCPGAVVPGCLFELPGRRSSGVVRRLLRRVGL